MSINIVSVRHFWLYGAGAWFTTRPMWPVRGL